VERYSQHRSVSRAIRRSGALRARIERRRRRSIVAATAVSLSVALGMAVSLASFTGTDLADAAVSRAKGLMELLDQRSPGARTEGELTKTKRAMEVLAERQPVVPKNLAEVLSPPQSMLVPVDIAAPAPAIELASAIPPGIIVPPGFPPGGGIVTPPGGGIITPPGGGGGTPPPGPPETPPDTPHGPPPLPEPGTWMTMLLGFGLAGWALRRNRAAGTRLAA
jgi:hypothetical protein